MIAVSCLGGIPKPNPISCCRTYSLDGFTSLHCACMNQNRRELEEEEEILAEMLSDDHRRVEQVDPSLLGMASPSSPMQERIVAKAAEREANQGSEETRAEIVRLLLRKKADANAKSQCGSTPLYLASRDGV